MPDATLMTGISKESDPTALTTDNLRHEIAVLKELLFTRLDAMDKAMIIFNENITRVPTDVDKQVGHLKSLNDEKFRSIQIQFAERDTRTEQTSRDSKVAVDAALQAAKEAVGEQNKSSALAIAKSETATTKQIDQLVVLIQTSNAALSDKIDDLKERIGTIEGRGVGAKEAVGEQRANTSTNLGVIGGVIGFIGLVAALVVDLMKHP